MHRHQDAYFYLNEDDGRTKNPDDQSEFAKALIPESPYWPHLVAIDPGDLMKTRRLQLLYLARYAHQSLFVWDQVDVDDLALWVQALSDLISQEHPLITEQENT